MKLHARDIYLTGIVQGVGMRPTVYRHAQAAGVGGWVLNGVGGVRIHICGNAKQLASFEELLQAGYPPQSLIESYSSHEVEPDASDEVGHFLIAHSDAQDSSAVFVSPDIATCDNCTQELFDPSNRRYRYPFINCTDCGPRFTVIADLPYDRPKTSMADFPLCPECNHEYHDPTNRRFDAQPNACFICGPQLEWRYPRTNTHYQVEGTSVEELRQASDRIITACVDALKAGKIIAIKGLGGFHLACDAQNQEAVMRLRKRKRRSDKALALMVPSLECARQLAQINPQEEALLCSSMRPIVLLKHRPNHKLAPAVTLGLPELGIMLPYTPLHHLILHDCQMPLVMTSGNLSDEPICIDEEEAMCALAGIADCFLLHNRRILSRYDDSVLRVLDDKILQIRRARGLAPAALKLPQALQERAKKLGCALPSVKAFGAEQKNTFCITRDSAAFVSQHLGDLEDHKSFENYRAIMSDYERLFRLTPEILACDLHPEYLSTKYAKDCQTLSGLKLYEVAHHHAHICATSAEFNYDAPLIGLALDGTGLGADRQLWGGEILLSNWSSSKRVAHLEKLWLPGGAAAIKRPARIAYLFSHQHGLLEHPALSHLNEQLDAQEQQMLVHMYNHQLNCPASTSAGRLFDCASSLLGICYTSSYEGQAAIDLEAEAHKLSEARMRELEEELLGAQQALGACASEANTLCAAAGAEDADSTLVLKSSHLLKELLEDRAAGLSAAEASFKFHLAFVKLVCRAATMLARAHSCEALALSGGCFMNRILLHYCTKVLQGAGFSVLIGQSLPQNDACISYGQAVSALSCWLDEREETQ